MDLSLDEPPSVFDSHGDTYAAISRTSPFNRDYDRPTILALAGDIAGDGSSSWDVQQVGSPPSS
ncbi:hypothetical protein C1Y40_04579 [Mycobacterium talmoniae]|uniref:Uncharacterized protein n=1 Tax=Mycobacterium talmoniae TaxID=1858794 RepID=A0A2S8BF55_9MYCO|nr:hypothetical protein C1Y40_04579 [Mycobacterium talmoniae]